MQKKPHQNSESRQFKYLKTGLYTEPQDEKKKYQNRMKIFKRFSEQFFSFRIPYTLLRIIQKRLFLK